MLHDTKAGHRSLCFYPRHELAERLAVGVEEQVQQEPSRRVSEGTEHGIAIVRARDIHTSEL